MEIVQHRIPNADLIAVVTNCLYKNFSLLPSGKQRYPEDTDGIRGDLALELVDKALGLEARIVVCEGGSSPEFLSALEKSRENGLVVVHSDIPMRGPQRRKAFEAAITLPKVRAILYTQAEKSALLDNLTLISKPALDNEAEIVIPKRESSQFKRSYPEYMWKSEMSVNATYDWLMRRAGLMKEDESLDWFFGPVVFKNDPEVVNLFLAIYELRDTIRSRIGVQPRPEMHSNGHYFPIIQALFENMRVMSVEVPFVYPQAQKINETSLENIDIFRKRREQDAAIYRLEAIHFLAFLKSDPRSMIKQVFP